MQAHATTPQQHSAQLPSSLMKTALAVIGVLALVGFAAVVLFQIGFATGQSGESSDADAEAIAAIMAAQTPDNATPALVQPVAIKLHATLITSNGNYEAGEQPVLASGSTFALSLQSNKNGHAHIFAVAPDGFISHIWNSRMQARQAQLTPAMRLHGMRGTETLRIVFVPSDKDAGQSSPSVVRTLTLLHI